MGITAEERNDELRRRLVTIAEQQLGKPYVYGAAPGSSEEFDCSSFVQFVYAHIGIDIPRCTIDQARFGEHIIHSPIGVLQAGDLVFIRGEVGRYTPDFPEGIGHVYIAINGLSLIHAQSRADDGGSVVCDNIIAVNKKQKITAVRRLLVP